MRYRFAGFELDTERLEFQAEGEIRALEPQVFDVLRYLVENADRVVSRDELIAAVWQGRIMSDATISVRINAVRKALGDSGARQDLVKTIPRRGFRLAVAVESLAASVDRLPPAAAAVAPPSDRPSIAVLAFDDLGSASDQGYFADGITDDIITELCRYPDLLVIGRHSSFVYRGQNTDAKTVGRELGVRYVLEGGVRRSGDRLRVTTRLIDAATDHQVWAERYDRELADVFDIQAEIARLVVGAVGANLHEATAARTAQADPSSLSAYELALRAYARFSRNSRSDLEASRDFARQAIALDPAYARAYSTLAWTHIQDRFSGFTDDPARSLDLAFDAATKAVALDRTDPFACISFSMVLLHMHQHDRALAELDRAIALSPSYSEAYAQKANVLGFMSRTDEAIAAVETAIRLNPHSPGWYHLMRGRAYLAVGRLSDALAPLEAAVALSPAMPQGHAALAIAYTGAGQLENARSEVKAIQDMSPGFTCAYLRKTLPYKDRAVLDEQLLVLAAAGLPE